MVQAPDDIEAGDYELIIETYDLHEPNRVLNTHTMTIEVIEEFQEVEPVALAPIILEQGLDRYDSWRLLTGVPYSVISWMETLYVDLSGVEDFVRLDGWKLKVVKRGLKKAEPGVYYIWFLAIYIDEVLPANYFYQVITVLPEEEEEEEEYIDPWVPDEPEEEEQE